MLINWLALFCKNDEELAHKQAWQGKATSLSNIRDLGAVSNFQFLTFNRFD